MKWQGGRKSSNVIDRRSSGGRRAAVGGGGLGVLAIVVIGWLLGVDLSPMLGLSGDNQIQSGGGTEITAADEERAAFAATVLGYTEDVWSEVFRTQVNQPYQPPKLVLFSGQTDGGACGLASAATGPFYCPGNRFAYLDTDFFVTLDRRMGAGGDFAAAYVIAHEVAHHVQNELGILPQVNRLRAQVGQSESNALSVRVELQADCYAGIWARHAHERLNVLERGDIAEAMNAAAQIGDDTLQRQAGGVVRPDSFTHGSSEQRQRWFARGLESGRLEDCDTFGTDRL
ncbi:MAG: hypothetical protein CSA72_10395 [Rhodobacterales bacterium]|nr:MAG: hypothetical protein CSA72_10395 [Rhodobacterales bacterium]